MKYKLSNPWIWFGAFSVALFFITQMVLSWCISWAVSTTTIDPTSHVGPAQAALGVEMGQYPYCDIEGLEYLSGWCVER
jgi:hypothetical protein